MGLYVEQVDMIDPICVHDIYADGLGHLRECNGNLRFGFYEIREIAGQTSYVKVVGLVIPVASFLAMRAQCSAFLERRTIVAPASMMLS